MQLKDGEGRGCFWRRKKLLGAWDLVLLSIGLLAWKMSRLGMDRNKHSVDLPCKFTAPCIQNQKASQGLSGL